MIVSRFRAEVLSLLRHFFLIIVILTVTNPIHPQRLPESQDQAKLNKVLEAAGDYCEKLKNMALNFFCHENIKEKTYEFRKTLFFRLGSDKPPLSAVEDLKTIKTVKTSYVYDYQMIKKGEDFKERRDLLEENGKKRNQKDVEPKTLRMSAKYLVFGPVGFLSKAWQPHFQYELLGAGKIDDRNAILIRATPREITPENYCFGRIWIDDNDTSILQIEWEPQSIANFKETVDSPIGELKRRIVWTVAYDVVKNGVRFPSAQSIKEIYVTKNGKEHTKYEGEYIYDQYRFFTVKTEVVLK